MKKWKLGLAVALADGFVNGVILWSLAPDTPLRAALAILAYNTARSVKTYFSENPIMKNKLNSAVVLMFLLGLSLASGCVSYVAPDGTRLSSFLQASHLEGLRVSPKTGLSVKTADSSTDTDALKAIAEGVAAGVAKGVKP